MTVKQLEIQWQYPFLKAIEKPPFKRNQHVIHTPPSGTRFAFHATVESCVWDDSVGLNGEWCVAIAYYPYTNGVQDTSKMWRTVCGVKSLKKVR